MDYLLYVFHIAMLLFWIRLWSAPSKEFYFNPFLSGTTRLTDSVLAFLRPVLALPEQAAALAVLLFVLLFKTVMFWRLGGEWDLRVGMVFSFAPHPHGDGFAPVLLASVLQAALFFVRLWTVFLLVRLITPAGRATRATEAFDFFARPFSKLPLIAQPVVLLALHLLLAIAITQTSAVTVEPLLAKAVGTTLPAASDLFTADPVFVRVLRIGWLAVLSFADGLMVLTRGLIILIIGNLGAALFRSHGAMVVCSEGVELLLGRFAKRGATGAGFDFTPLIFFFVTDLLYKSICGALFKLIHLPLMN
jgi:hypothetical protein